MKKILLLTASYGEGHNSAARGIRDGLARVAPNVEVELHDLFAESYAPLNEFVRKAYLAVINRWPRSWGYVYRWLDRKQDFDKSFRRFSQLKDHLAALLARFRPDVDRFRFSGLSLSAPADFGTEQNLQERCRCHRLDHGQRNLVPLQRRLLSCSK